MQRKKNVEFIPFELVQTNVSSALQALFINKVIHTLTDFK